MRRLVSALAACGAISCTALLGTFTVDSATESPDAGGGSTSSSGGDDSGSVGDAAPGPCGVVGAACCDPNAANGSPCDIAGNCVLGKCERAITAASNDSGCLGGKARYAFCLATDSHLLSPVASPLRVATTSDTVVVSGAGASANLYTTPSTLSGDWSTTLMSATNAQIDGLAGLASSVVYTYNTATAGSVVQATMPLTSGARSSLANSSPSHPAGVSVGLSIVLWGNVTAPGTVYSLTTGAPSVFTADVVTLTDTAAWQATSTSDAWLIAGGPEVVTIQQRHTTNVAPSSVSLKDGATAVAIGASWAAWIPRDGSVRACKVTASVSSTTPLSCDARVVWPSNAVDVAVDDDMLFWTVQRLAVGSVWQCSLLNCLGTLTLRATTADTVSAIALDPPPAPNGARRPITYLTAQGTGVTAHRLTRLANGQAAY